VTYRELALHARTGAGWSTALLGFTIPVSTALDGILTALVLVLWIAAVPFAFRETLRVYASSRAALLALALFALLFVSAAWSSVTLDAAVPAAAKYLDLALIPLFAWAAATTRLRKWALIGFLAAIVLNLCVSYGTALGLWESLPGLRTFPHYPIGFRLSVTHNFLVSIAAFVLLLIARELRVSAPRAALVSVVLAVACMCNVLFVVIGRTGYVVLGALLVYFAVTVTRDRRSAFVAALVLTALFASAYLGSSAFSYRIQDVASDLLHWKPGAGDETSVGQRIGYYRTTTQIIVEHPLTGVGAGGFEQAYADKVRGTEAPPTTNPHNDYLMIAAQAGLPAAALLLALYLLMWRDASRLGSRLERDLLRGLVIAVALGGLFNSLLLDHAEGLLFAWAAGVLCSGARGWTAA
jgi:O-antigen ligase